MADPGEDEQTAEDPAAGQAAAGADDDAAAAAGYGVDKGYGVGKARALLRMFREDTGRDAETAHELAEWMIRRNR